MTTETMTPEAVALLPRHMRDRLEAAPKQTTTENDSVEAANGKAGDQIDDAKNGGGDEGGSDLAAVTGRWKKAQEEIEGLKAVRENNAFLQGKLLEQQEALKKSGETAAQAEGWRKELEAIKAKQPVKVFEPEERDELVNSFGEDGVAVLERFHARKAALPSDAVTKADLQKFADQQKQSEFAAKLPKEFYELTRSPNTDFMKWAKDTRDGRKMVLDEISAITSVHDLEGLPYVLEKVEQFKQAKNGGQQKGTPIKPTGSSSAAGQQLTPDELAKEARRIAKENPTKFRELMAKHTVTT